MTFKTDIAEGVDEVFNELGDAIINVSYDSVESLSSAQYDPQTRVVTQRSGDGGPFTVRALVYDQEDRVVAGLQTQDLQPGVLRVVVKKMLLIQSELPVSPKSNDRVVISGLTSLVDTFEADPTNTIWVIALKENK